MERYQSSSESEHFDESVRHFRGMLAELASSSALSLEHGTLESLLNREGTELLRKLMQDHLKLRSLQEKEHTSIVGADGVTRTHRRSRSRPLKTLFGEVRVNRVAYGARNHLSLVPMDAELNLPSDLYSHGLRKKGSEEAARGSFGEAMAAIERSTGTTVPKRQLEEIVRSSARDFDAFYESKSLDKPEETKDLLVLSLDGKGIIVRPQDLRKTSQQRLKKSQKTFDKRRGTGEKPRKRMATVATVYTLSASARTPEQIMGNLGSGTNSASPQIRPRAENKRVWASLEHSAPQVMEQAIQEALRRDPKQQRQWILLVDGDPHQIARFERVAKKYDVRVSIVMDFIHVIEKLWNAAWAFFEKNDPAAESWVTKRALKVLRGESSQVAAGIRRSATLRGVTGWQRLSVDKAANYLLKNRKYLRYDRALEDGWPIATGIVEGACRYLIKDRMDITGARWSIAGAEAVLRFRALRSSGDFERYWDFHRKNEQIRNHANKYAEAA